jgi:ATP-dependent 26S proteasome regulatory subunit
MLDATLLRPGRLDRRNELPQPDRRQRGMFFKLREVRCITGMSWI